MDPAAGLFLMTAVMPPDNSGAAVLSAGAS